MLLPPPAGALLMDQDAPKNGAMFFELTSLGGRTHAGVLDFSAPSGTVVLPRKVRFPSLCPGAVPRRCAPALACRRHPIPNSALTQTHGGLPGPGELPELLSRLCASV